MLVKSERLLFIGRSETGIKYWILTSGIAACPEVKLDISPGILFWHKQRQLTEKGVFTLFVLDLPQVSLAEKTEEGENKRDNLFIYKLKYWL